MVPIRKFTAFENESDSFTLEGLTVENKVDRISIHGTIDITLDKSGYEKALELKRVIDSAVNAMKYADLPDEIEK